MSEVRAQTWHILQYFDTVFNIFYATVFFLYPLKTFQNLWQGMQKETSGMKRVNKTFSSQLTSFGAVHRKQFFPLKIVFK